MKKICKKCGEFREYHAKGLCHSCYDKKWQKENPEKANIASKKWQLKNPEKAKANKKKYYLENKEKFIVAAKKWRLENPEKAKATAKKWRLENPEKIKAQSKKYCFENKEKINRYYLENKEKILEYNRKYRLEHLEKEKTKKKKWYIKNFKEIKTKQKKYRFENPGKMREIKLRRRGYGIVKKGVIDRVINANIFKYGILTCENTKGKKEDGHCKHCENGFHIDHIIPVSKGGSNDYNNLQILCAHCNCSKHTEIIDYREKSNNNQLYLR